MELNQIIDQRRKEKGFSIRALANVLKVDKSAVQHWVKGRRTPNAYNSLMLSLTLDIPLDVICRNGEPSKTVHRAFVKADKTEIKHITRFMF